MRWLWLQSAPIKDTENKEPPGAGGKMTATLKLEAPRKTLALLLALTTALGPAAAPSFAASKTAAAHNHGTTATPIQHLVVIFQENVSFDHYFATYPVATNP